MKHYFAAAGIACMAAISPLEASAATFNQIFVFGDSLADPGNLFQASGGLVPQTPPYAQRFSNGPVWVEYLADSLNLDPIRATDFLSGLPLNGEDGVNFAVGGASTGTNLANFPLPLGVLSQVESFEQLVSSNVLQPADDALYIYVAGGNDIAANLAGTPGFADISTFLSNTTAALQDLINIGAQNILVSNVPDLGATPRFNGLPSAGVITNIVNSYNQSLAAILDSLSLSNPTANLIGFDLNGLFGDAIANPTNYGFMNVTDACLSGFDSFPPDDSFNICDAPDSYLFWDNFHPSTAAHAIVADVALAQLHEPEAVPEPSVRWSLVALGTVVVGGTLHRRCARLKLR
ncbi:MAG: SGNH/GDSL hydrolase family protein [Thainema sp.]